jgi:hypothetical protein
LWYQFSPNNVGLSKSEKEEIYQLEQQRKKLLTHPTGGFTEALTEIGVANVKFIA